MLTGKLFAMALTAFLQLLCHESELSTTLPQTRTMMDYIKLVAFKTRKMLLPLLVNVQW